MGSKSMFIVLCEVRYFYKDHDNNCLLVLQILKNNHSQVFERYQTIVIQNTNCTVIILYRLLKSWKKVSIRKKQLTTKYSS